MPQLFLDCDGVLADFDAGATTLFGMSPKAFEAKYGSGRFWGRLAKSPDFYGTLPLMPGAMKLFDAVREHQPIILTGLPRGKWAAEQKVRWAAEHFPGTRIITCMAAEKSKYAKPGDVLVDDNVKYRHLWEAVGGIFVHHQDVTVTLGELARHFELSVRSGT